MAIDTYASIAILCFLTFFITAHFETAVAQFVPLPPPSPSNANSTDEVRRDMKDNKAPIIDILSTSLKAGKNVFKAKITDESGIKLAEIKYVHNGIIKTVDFVKDPNNVYKALIDIQPPSRVIVIDAEDPNGNVATAVREYNVQIAPNVLQQIEDFFSGFLNKH